MERDRDGTLGGVLGLFGLGAALPAVLPAVGLSSLFSGAVTALYWAVVARPICRVGAPLLRPGLPTLGTLIVAVVGLACWAAAVGAFYPEAGIAWRASQAEIAGSWPWALILVFFAPLAEERFFRGLLFARLASHGRPIFALFGSAAAFAAAHSVPGPAVVAAGGGLILGGLRLWSGDWRTPAIAHVAFNALVFSVGFSVGGG